MLNTSEGRMRVSLRELGRHSWFFAMFYKADNFCKFPFAFLHNKPLEKGSTLKGKKMLHFFFSFKRRSLFRIETKKMSCLPMKVYQFPIVYALIVHTTLSLYFLNYCTAGNLWETISKCLNKPKYLARQASITCRPISGCTLFATHLAFFLRGVRGLRLSDTSTGRDTSTGSKTNLYEIYHKYIKELRCLNI